MHHIFFACLCRCNDSTFQPNVSSRQECQTVRYIASLGGFSKLLEFYEIVGHVHLWYLVVGQVHLISWSGAHVTTDSMGSWSGAHVNTDSLSSWSGAHLTTDSMIRWSGAHMNTDSMSCWSGAHLTTDSMNRSSDAHT